MAEPRGDLDLAIEPVHADRPRELGMEQLDRDRALVPLVARQVHGRHPTLAEQPLHRVATEEGRANGGQAIRHRLGGAVQGLGSSLRA
jgi:hypothetical protein